MIYLTGAQYSLKRTEENPQADPAKSLGGFISSSPVPNGSLNALFDLISSDTLTERPRETMAIALINKLDVAVSNVELKIVVGNKPICAWRVAAVAPNDSLAVESIPNRYAEPLNATFYDATFVRAAVEFNVTVPPSSGESFAILPIGFTAELLGSESGLEGLWKAMRRAASRDVTFAVERVSENKFRVAYRDETEVAAEGIECSLLTDGGMRVEFEGKFRNINSNSVIIADELSPEGAIVLWLQREISPEWGPLTDEQLIEDFKHHVVSPQLEEADIVITYEEATETVEENQQNNIE